MGSHAWNCSCWFWAQAEADLWNADPFDPEAQRRIAERIQQEQVEHNYVTAMEHNPEVRASTCWRPSMLRARLRT